MALQNPKTFKDAINHALENAKDKSHAPIVALVILSLIVKKISRLNTQYNAIKIRAMTQDTMISVHVSAKGMSCL